MGGGTQFYGQNDFMDIWAFFILVWCCFATFIFGLRVLEGLGWWPHSNVTLTHSLLGGWCYCFVLFLFDLVFFGPHSSLTLSFFVFFVGVGGGGGFFWSCKRHPRKNKTTQPKTIKKRLVFQFFCILGGCASATEKTDWDRTPQKYPNQQKTHQTQTTCNSEPTQTPPKWTNILPKSFLFCPFIFGPPPAFFFFYLRCSQYQKAGWCWVNKVMSRKEDTTQN